MSADKRDDEMNDPFDDLFGKPCLLEGEDKERYQRLCTAIIRDLKPKNVFEWINARDQVDKIWEEQRYKRAATALINGGLFKAVEFYLREICQKQSRVMPSAGLALKYFSNNAKERKEVFSLLAQYGITIDELHAKAAQIEAGSIQTFDRMVAARENGRRLLRKEAEQYAKRQNLDPNETTEN
jgi:hypothetical protein